MARTYTLSTNNKHVLPSEGGHLYLQTAEGEFRDLCECRECKLEGDILFNAGHAETEAVEHLASDIYELEWAIENALNILLENYHSAKPAAFALPLPVDILRRGRCTIVKWTDGTVTKVVLEEDKPDTGIFGAFCIAFAKKMYGSTEKLLKHIDNADEKARAVRVKAAAQECQEQCKKRAEARRKEQFEREVAEEMHQARVRDEAMRRLWDKEKDKGEWME